MTQVSNERYSTILAEADRAHDSDEITLADNHLIVKKLNEGEFETADKMLTNAKELNQFENQIKTGNVVSFTEDEVEYISNYILNEPLTNQICLNYWTHIRNRCWSRLNQRTSDWAYNNRYRMFRRLGFHTNNDDSIILDFVVGFSFSNDLPVLIKKYIMTLLKSYDYPNENPENPLELSFHVIDADTHIILHDDHKSLEEAIGGNMMSNIWKSFIMTVKRRNNVPANYKFNPDVIPPMFDPTTAMEILLNRRKNPVYLSDIFTVEK